MRARSQRTPRLLTAALLLLGVGAVAACGDDGDEPRGGQDGGPGGGPGTDPDPKSSFPAFVIDLVENKTADDTEPVAIDYAVKDDESPDAFDSLFK